MENTDKSTEQMAGISQSARSGYLQAVANASAGTGASNVSTNGDLLDDGLVNMPGMRVEGKVANVRGKDGKVYKNSEPTKCGRIEKRMLDNSQRAPAGDTITSEKVLAHDIHPGSKFAGTGWDDTARADTMVAVKRCAKDALLFGGMEALFFYWQQTEQMVTQAAYPAIVVCATLAGLSVGINIGKYIHSVRPK